MVRRRFILAERQEGKRVPFLFDTKSEHANRGHQRSSEQKIHHFGIDAQFVRQERPHILVVLEEVKDLVDGVAGIRALQFPDC